MDSIIKNEVSLSLADNLVKNQCRYHNNTKSSKLGAVSNILDRISDYKQYLER